MKRINEMINMLTWWDMSYQHQDDTNTFHHIKYGVTRLHLVRYSINTFP